MSERLWLAAPMKDINPVVELSGLDNYFFPENQFHQAEPITVSLRGVNVVENMDVKPWNPSDKNDLLIVTLSQFGKEPPVQKLHFMKGDVECGWQGDFFSDIIVAMRDFKDLSNDLAMRVQVYDMDKFDKSLLDSVCNIAQSTAVAFPALAAYVGAASIGAQAAANLVDNIDQHDMIIDQRIRLEAAESHIAHNLLQPGYFVCFRRPVTEGEAKYLDSQLHVLDSDKKEFKGCSYAVVEIQKEFRQNPEIEIDQKAAKLASELDGKGQSGKAALEFLKDTLNTYTKFKNLQRAKELEEKEKAGTITEAEKKLLDELKENKELKPFL
jgi:hypothetical protein